MVRPFCIAAVTAMIALPSAAFAHTGHDAVFSLAAGFLHPMGGLDHVLAMVAIGFLAAQIGGRGLWLVPASFVGVMLVGAAAGFAGLGLPFSEVGIAASVVVLGGLIALRAELPVALAMALAASFGIFHGYAHGAEMPATGSAGFAAGFILASGMLHLAGISLGILAARLESVAFGQVIRLGGGAVAAAGLVLAYAAI